MVRGEDGQKALASGSRVHRFVAREKELGALGFGREPQLDTPKNGVPD